MKIKSSKKEMEDEVRVEESEILDAVSKFLLRVSQQILGDHARTDNRPLHQSSP